MPSIANSPSPTWSRSNLHRPYLRSLVEADWRTLRDLRLLALRTEPGMYFSTLEAEFGYSEAQWRALAANADDRQRVFGLFDGEVLVGVTAAFTYRDDPSGQTALFGMSYLRPEYRGEGHAQRYYDARMEWVRSIPRFTRVRVSHRRSNEPSRRAIVRAGFSYAEPQKRVWPDGIEEDEFVYGLELGSPIVIRPRTPADMEACVAMLRAVHERDDYPSSWPDDPARWLTPKSLLGAWVAVRGAAIQGHVAIGSFADEVNGVPAPAGEVKRLFVHPSARGGGTGAMLLWHAASECRAVKLYPVLQVRDAQRTAIALYERDGWKRLESYRASWQTPDGETPLIHIYADRAGSP